MRLIIYFYLLLLLNSCTLILPKKQSVYTANQLYEFFEKKIYDKVEGYRRYVDIGLDSKIFIYDLTADKFIFPPSYTDIHINHLYHFGSMYIPHSFSYIAYLDKNGTLVFFEAINCKDRGNSLEDVLQFIEDNEYIKSDSSVLERVINYRKYGLYVTIDDDVLDCDCEPCDSDSIFDN